MPSNNKIFCRVNASLKGYLYTAMAVGIVRQLHSEESLTQKVGYFRTKSGTVIGQNYALSLFCCRPVSNLSDSLLVDTLLDEH
jgi:hypothetical protein